MGAMPRDSRVERERWSLITQLTRCTDKLMIALSVVWVGLAIKELTGPLSHPLLVLEYVIWLAFGLDFLLKFAVAPRKLRFLRGNWIALLSLVLPAFRLFRIVQAAGALRTVNVLRVLTSTNRSLRVVARAMGRRGVGYVVAITIIVLFGGAGGIYGFENPGALAEKGFSPMSPQLGGIRDYTDALWFTAMLMTTIGSSYWPVTAGARLLSFFISLYSLGVFGYITAALASIFVESDKSKNPKAS